MMTRAGKGRTEDDTRWPRGDIQQKICLDKCHFQSQWPKYIPLSKYLEVPFILQTHAISNNKPDPVCSIKLSWQNIFSFLTGSYVANTGKKSLCLNLQRWVSIQPPFYEFWANLVSFCSCNYLKMHYVYRKFYTQFINGCELKF